MATLNIQFDWTRGHFYDLKKPATKRGSKPATEDDWAIVQRDDVAEPIRPLEIHPSLHLDFAQLDGSPESCLGFVRKWGLLEVPQAHAGAKETIGLWRGRIEEMKQSAGGLRRAFAARHPIIQTYGAAIAPVDLKVIAGKPDGRPVLAFAPRTLRDAMRIQLAQSIVSGNSLHTCLQCGRWFERTEAKGRVAKFCSSEHRFQYHNERRSKP
jgi:hypothetical protein